ncbi:hypothetical protein [Oryza sativa Japonica Group]|uniref:Uncharacterized protein n=1 Tax=Oryza sativa subsp. japonica TaxID=39947 RepID=Q656D8_ORYSJ|nr:hypothetical protein [Oryza sativa Japonica Group]BAD88381.1 hypothetical protein [Oryza sativa Japonica Group]
MEQGNSRSNNSNKPHPTGQCIWLQLLLWVLSYIPREESAASRLTHNGKLTDRWWAMEEETGAVGGAWVEIR